MDQTIAAYDMVAKRFADRWFDLRLEEPMSRFTGRLRPGARVLDVGCGPGRDAAWLAELGFDAGGMDLSFGMLLEGWARGVSVPLIQADMRQLPFRRGSFQGLWVCASFLHIPKEQAGDALRELSRVVHPGHIYLAVKNTEGGPSDAHSDGSEEWVEDDKGHRFFFAYYTPSEIELLVERNGFEVLHCGENPDQSGRSRPWINVLARSKMNALHLGASPSS
jgi:ubiquinone/menaquinone biosynthesis C-methylase UbiE